MRDPVSRLGYHYFPDDRHFAASDLETWLPVLQSLSAKWITLQASPKRAVPEPFLRGLLDAGVEPIIHIPCQVDSLRLPDLSPMLASYGRWGVRYVVVFDRPNMKSSWNPSEWSRADLIERFLDQMSPVLHAQKEAGLRPTLPPLEPGGDYWDTAFLEGSLEGLVRRSAAVRPEDLTLALYAWTYGKPLNWGAGGQARWPEARPYRTPPKSQDQFGLHIFDWYAAVAQDTVGQVLPMLVIAGGALPEHAGGLDEDQHSQTNAEIARCLIDNEFPEALIGFVFFLLASEVDSPQHPSTWFPSSEQPREVVSLIRHLVAMHRQDRSGDSRLAFDHYVLLPKMPATALLRIWGPIGEFALNRQATVGFSRTEAEQSRKVTIVEADSENNDALASRLRQAGCQVERLTPQTGRIPEPTPKMPTDLSVLIETIRSGAPHDQP